MRISIPALLLLVTLAAGGDWITSGGNPWRSGLSDETGPQSRTLLWQGSLPAEFGAPVFIWQDKLVTMRFQSMSYAPIVCHDLATGETLWTRDFPGAGSRSLPIGFRDGRVYAVNFQESQHDTLYALDAGDGHILWRGRVAVWLSITESASFAEDGDLLVAADNFRIARVDCQTGDTVWTTSRVWPVTGSADVCVFDSTVYAYSGDIGSFSIDAYSLATGRLKYSKRIEDTHPGGPAPQAAPMVGDDGTVYAHRVGDNVTALRDTGDSLAVLWVHELSGEYPLYSAFAHFAVGPDRSVYVASSGRIQRLDPTTGAAVDSSDYLEAGFHVRLAVGCDSTVYLSTGAVSGGFYALTPDLDIIWGDTLPNINTSGPAIGPGGVLAVAGNGNALKVYAGGSAVSGPRPLPAPCPLRLVAQSTPAGVRLRFVNPAAGPVSIRVFDAAGRRLLGVTRQLAAGRREVLLPTRAAGVGFVHLSAGGTMASAKLVAAR
ncbi:hypothetical protein FJY71_06855 [candidate division WOR-3 bacterium]|nr:hypothetical protein [candidate division WOR-3 bacterium]